MENIKKAQILKSLFAEVFRAVNAFGDTKATVAEILKSPHWSSITKLHYSLVLRPI